MSFGSDEVTREVAARLLSDGTAWMTPSTWHGQAVLRISVSNWRTTNEDIDRTLDAVRRVFADASVQGGFQTNNQYAQQGTDGGAQYAASETESTASAGEEAVDRQQHRARDHGNPGVGTDW